LKFKFFTVIDDETSDISGVKLLIGDHFPDSSDTIKEKYRGFSTLETFKCDLNMNKLVGLSLYGFSEIVERKLEFKK